MSSMWNLPAEQALQSHARLVVFCGFFVGLILTTFGIVLLNRLLTVKYLNGTMNLNRVTLFVMAVWILTAFGFMLVLHCARDGFQ